MVINTRLGTVIPIIGVKYNPTNEWMKVVYRFFDNVAKDALLTPHYGGSPIEAVIMCGNIDLSDPNTVVAIKYEYLKWPGDTTVLGVFELEDGSLWQQLTDETPTSVYPGQPIISGRNWQDDFLLSSAARECVNLIGPAVKKLYFVKRLSDEGLKLHKSRLLDAQKIR